MSDRVFNLPRNGGVKLKDKKVEILRSLVTTDEWGNHVNTKVVVATAWAYVRHLSGEEVFRAAQVGQEEYMVFQIGWRDGIDSRIHSIRYKGEEYNITRVDAYEGYKADLRLYAKKARP